MTACLIIVIIRDIRSLGGFKVMMIKYRVPAFAKRLLVAVAIAGSAFMTSAHAADQPTAVVELFTSQGCSSCPPADKILGKYVKQGKVLALSWHVDYWNYLGWKDTFSKAEYTDRQRRYAVSFKRRGVYTPQAVVNGRTHVVGSRAGEIEQLVQSYQQGGKGLTVPVNVTRNGDAVRVSSKTDTAGEATLYIVYFDRSKKVKIKRGENRGRTITYHNVVRDMSMLGMAKGGVIDVTLPMKELRRKGHDACALILQKTTSAGTPGPIIGATVIDNLTDS